MNKKRRIVIEIIVGICLIATLYFFIPHSSSLAPRLSIGPRGRIEVDSGHRPVMGTFARVVSVAADSRTAKKAIEAAFEQLHSVELLMSTYRDDSETGKINHSAAKEPVRVSKSTFEVLQKALEFSKLSDGAFDITVGALSDLWRSAAEANSVPSDAELDEARSVVGYEKLILDGNDMSVRFAVDGMKLDAGGIAKGYAIDRAVEAMQRCGAIGGMVDVGGDIRCFGAPPRGKKRWLIGVQDPSETETVINTGRYLLVLKLTDAAVATSGHYRRFTLIKGKKYSHIIDTETGSGSDGLASVTIISKNATEADALATAVSVMGREKGLALIETIPQTEAILISSAPNFERIQTSGAEKYIHKK